MEVIEGVRRRRDARATDRLGWVSSWAAESQSGTPTDWRLPRAVQPCRCPAMSLLAWAQ